MYVYLGDFAAGSSIFVPFHTFNSSGASVTISGLAVTDVEVYKGASMTQRASDAGFALVDTDGIDLDGVTGIHGFTIDTSDNTDSGFYAAGNDYTVVVASITADSQTVNFIAARFSIENRVSNLTKILGTAVATPATAGLLDVNVKQISTDATAADNLELFMDGTGYAGGTTPLQVVLTTSGVNAVADQVWDEAASGHVAAGSFGAINYGIRSATAQAGAATTITLDASASAVDDFYTNQRIHIIAGTGAGQGRIISDYVGSTKVATVATWATNPGADSVFVITPFGSIPGASAPTASEVADAVWDELLAGHTTEASYGALMQALQLHVGTAQAGGASSITLDATGSSATDDLYNYQMITIRSGTGAGQTRQIIDYNGTTKVATVNLAWTTQPSTDSNYIVSPGGLDAATVEAVASAVWDVERASHVAAGSFGEYVLADATRISGDATAADNLEAMVDGTGLTLTGVTVPAVTTVGTLTTYTGNTPQTGDAFARLGAPAGASVSADVAAVKVDTAAILVDTGTTLDGKIDTIDTVVDAIKAKTDSLTFTQSGHVDANVQRINDVTVLGDGSATPWGP